MIAQPDTIPPGTVVAERYRLQRLIGRGGFGAVFAASDTRLRREVALKIMSGTVLAEAGGEPRFRREAELASRLDHPGAVRVLDSGTDGRGLYYIAFELLEGRSVEAAMIVDGPIAARQAAGIAIDVLGALEEAHRVGVLHRDIKPANVFLVRASGGAHGVSESISGESVKVLDFGIAKSMNPNTIGLTRQGTSMGTPVYMAPEQITGQPIGPYSDLYALGLVLGEMVLGQSPYGSNASAVAIVAERIEGKGVPFPPRLVGTPLGPILLRATAPAALRYKNATEMRQALLAALPSLSNEPLPRSAGGGAFVEAPTAVAPNEALPTERSPQIPGARQSSPRAMSVELGSNAIAVPAIIGAPSPDPAARRRLEATVRDDGTMPVKSKLATTVPDDAARPSSKNRLAVTAPDSAKPNSLAATVLDQGSRMSATTAVPHVKRSRTWVVVVVVLAALSLAGAALALAYVKLRH